MTELNDHSSRSHAIVRVTVYSVNRTTKATRQGFILKPYLDHRFETAASNTAAQLIGTFF